MSTDARINNRIKVLLIGNYAFDGSTSMQIWASALHRELIERGVAAELIVPKPVFGLIKPSSGGLGKWLGYIDRFLLFPRRLKAAAVNADVVHICDHGSAMFVFDIKAKPVLVTCHDMLAVRGALGEIPEMRSSLTGRLLQLWIRRGLRRATRVACVSQFTLGDVRRILHGDRNLCKVLNGLNYPFQPLDSEDVERRLAHLPNIQSPFVLHIGSNHARKNREGVLRVFAKAARQIDLRLVIAGEALSNNLKMMARELRIDNRIIEIVKPRVEVIEGLYNRAAVFLFPSRYEGFGWPPIEAQACRCPVVASNIPPLVESLGYSAELFSLDDEDGMGQMVVRLVTDDEYREAVRRRGLENVYSRFQTSRMMDDYLAVYRNLLRLSSRSM